MIAYENPKLVKEIVDTIKEAYRYRYEHFEPYEYKVTTRYATISEKFYNSIKQGLADAPQYVYIYIEPVDKSVFDLNEKKKVKFIIDQYSGKLYENLRFDNLSSLHSADLFLMEAESLRFFYHQYTEQFSDKMWKGLMEYVRVVTRYGIDVNNDDIIRIDLEESILEEMRLNSLLVRYNPISSKINLTVTGKSAVSNLIRMGFDYRYVESHLGKFMLDL